VRFASLGSGSKGNATLVEQHNTCIMIDCGFSAVEVERRMARLDKHPQDINALLITHEHGDHIRGVGVLARKYSLPVYVTHGTLMQSDIGELPSLHVFDSHENFSIGDVEIMPFPVPHDAREPCQFIFSNGDKRLGLLTDTGSITAHICAQLTSCHGMILECNHDPDLLANGDYPPTLKWRVGGDMGHLSNAQAADLLQSVDTGQLQHLVAAHLSEKHNTPELAQRELSEALSCAADWIGVIDQEQGLPWRSL
jgi:phosphoribosyl 1,2-cyclic phosphodiesterase